MVLQQHCRAGMPCKAQPGKARLARQGLPKALLQGRFVVAPNSIQRLFFAPCLTRDSYVEELDARKVCS
jgi:hypothetical protein